MSCIDSNLIGDETIIYRGVITKWAFFSWVFLGLIVAAFTFGIGLLFIILGYFVVRSNEAAVTNKRFISKTGLFQRNTVEIPLTKVSSLQIHQRWDERLFGYGSLIISDSGNTYAPIKFIKDPLAFRRHFFEQQEKCANS